jgi:hypothetical protein
MFVILNAAAFVLLVAVAVWAIRHPRPPTGEDPYRATRRKLFLVAIPIIAVLYLVGALLMLNR